MCGIKWIHGFFSFGFLLILVNGFTDSRIVDHLGDDEPSFGSSIENISVPIGREAALSCSVKNLGNFKVGWMRASDQAVLALANRVVTHNLRYMVTQDEPNVWKFKIKSVRESDRGCYMCQINTTPMQKQLGCVDVYVPPDISDDGTSSDMTIKEGENASLYCNAHGHPVPRITWRRSDGTPIWMPFNNSTYNNTYIRNINSKKKVDTFGGNFLNLTEVQREQSGDYLCIASNDVPPAVSKRIVLNVQFAPNVTTQSTLLGSYVDSNVTIECNVEAFPIPVNYWIKGTKSLKTYDDSYYYTGGSNQNYIGGSIGTGNTGIGTNSKDGIISPSKKYEIREEKISGYKSKILLKIINFDEEDDGTYTCISSNTFGKANKTIRIYAKKRPTTTTTTTTTTPAPTTTTTTQIFTTPATTVVTTQSTTTSTDNYIEFSYTPNHYPDLYIGDTYVNQPRSVQSPGGQTGNGSSRLVISNCILSIIMSLLQR